MDYTDFRDGINDSVVMERIAVALETLSKGAASPEALEQAIGDTRKDLYRQLMADVVMYRMKAKADPGVYYDSLFAACREKLRVFKQQYPEIVKRTK